MKTCTAVLAALLFAVAAYPNLARSAEGPYHDYLVAAQMETARSANERGDFEAVVVALSASLNPDVYSKLSPKLQYEVITLYRAGAMGVGDWVNAHRASTIATASPASSLDDWSIRLVTASVTNDAQDAFASFKHLRAESPGFSSSLSLDEITGLDELFTSMTDAGKTRTGFRDMLDRDEWQTVNPFENATSFWLPIATTFIEQGRPERAARAFKRITDPASLVAISADRRFDAIVAGNKNRLAPRAAAEAWLMSVQRSAANEPNSMEGQIAIARAFFALNRSDEALRVLNAALAGVDQVSEKHPSRFEDFYMQVANAFSWKGEILLSIGKTDEGFAAMRRSASMLQGNLQTQLLLASRLNVYGRPEEALAHLSSLQLRSPDERPVAMAEIRTCTLAHLNRTNEITADLRYLRRHAETDPRYLLTAQLCVNDQDGVAETYIAMLRDPMHRGDALRDLQTYSDKGLAPYSRILRQRSYDVRSRKDVQAAIAKVGRVLAVDLRKP
jgi:tetratricopeptide (TPR) repeat protein